MHGYGHRAYTGVETFHTGVDMDMDGDGWRGSGYGLKFCHLLARDQYSVSKAHYREVGDLVPHLPTTYPP